MSDGQDHAVDIQVQHNPLIIRAVYRDVSPALRDMNPPPREVDGEYENEPPRPIPHQATPMLAHATASATHVSQVAIGSATIPGPLTTFEGQGQGFSGPSGSFTVQSAPPDTDGDVGPSHYVQIVNSSFTIFNKSGTAVLGPRATNTLWSGMGNGCANNDDGDGVVRYDRMADRWVIAQFSVSTTPYLQCVAISTTNDPTGSYYRYAFQFTDFPDYPKMGLWPDAYYFTFNMFAGGSTFSGAKSCAMDRTKMLAGQSATMQCFDTGTSWGGLLAGDLDGPTLPPSGEANLQTALGTNQLGFWKFHVDWNTPANSTFTGPVVVNVNSFSELCNGGTCVTQPSTNQKLDSLADRLMNRFSYRNFGDHEAMLVSHAVTSGSAGGMRWYEIRNPSAATPTIFQQGTYAPDSNYRWMGSLAFDKAGDIGLGFSISSSSISPSVRYTGRAASDPAGTMGFSEGTLVTGAGAQSGQSLSRWGDYSSMNIDPSDDCTFWYTQEYMAATGAFNWHTRIGSFQLPGCTGTGTTTTTSSSSGSTSSGSTTTSSGSTTGTTTGGSTSSGSTGGTTGSGIVNGGFETGSLSGWTAAGTAAAVSGGHSGTYAARVGSTGPTNGDSSVSQTFTANGSSLSFFYKVVCPDTVTYDWATATLKDNTAGTTATVVAKTCSNSGSWVQATAAVTSGHSYTLTLTSHDDNYSGDATYTLYDDVTISGGSTTGGSSGGSTGGTTGGGISNGGFETGSLSGWTATGASETAVSGGHSGSYAARLGSTSPTNGDSSIAQTFTAPSGSSQVSFWYNVTCPDTVTYDWATATLKDNTAGTSTTMLAKTCTNGAGWKQVTASVTAGHSYTLTLTSHDDNYSGDATYTLFDDAAVQ